MEFKDEKIFMQAELKEEVTETVDLFQQANDVGNLKKWQDWELD